MQQTAISRFNRTKLKTASILKKEKKTKQTLAENYTDSEKQQQQKNILDLFYVECDTVIFKSTIQ